MTLSPDQQAIWIASGAGAGHQFSGDADPQYRMTTSAFSSPPPKRVKAPTLGETP